MMRIVINSDLPAEAERRIRALSPTLELVHVAPGTAQIPPAVLRETQVVYTGEANFDPADAPRLRWVQVDAAAVDHFANKPIFRSTIPIANVRGAYSIAVAECAIAMLLALTRRLPQALNFQAVQQWPVEYEPLKGTDLLGKTMGIVGYGSIGRRIARLASAMGMNVLACKSNPEHRREPAESVLLAPGDPEGTIPQGWFGIDQLAEMLAQCDIAMITLPLTEQTRGLMGKRQLQVLPAGVYLVNVGRGHVVDETALAELLKAGKLAGAALDVFANEPLEADSPLWGLSNVLLLPHIASYTDAQMHRAAEVFVENLKRDLAGQPLINLVDKELGY